MPISKQFLSDTYLKQHLSATEIANQLHYSENKVRYWLEKHSIPIRSRSDANYFKYNPNGNPFQIKTNLNKSDSNLYHIALGLYWGEGNKNPKAGIRLGNSDPNLLIIWCKFLREICQVNENKIHFSLQIFKDNNITKAKKYWSKRLSIEPSRIWTGKPTKSLGAGTYRKISQTGVMTISVYNIKIGKWMFDELQKVGYNLNR